MSDEEKKELKGLMEEVVVRISALKKLLLDMGKESHTLTQVGNRTQP